MERASLLLVLWFYFLIVHSPTCIRSSDEGDALYAFKKGLSGPGHVLDSWDSTLINPCTWLHISCDKNNNVTRVDLGYCNLSGSLVRELGSLTKLQYLVLYGNKINGTIPKELGNLASLMTLDLHDNSLTGTIPKELAKLKNLNFLLLNDNKLSGDFPVELQNVTHVFPKITSVNLTNNQLNCPVAYVNCTWTYPHPP